MNNSPTYSMTERNYLREWYGRKHVSEIAAHLGRPVGGIRQAAVKLKLTGRGWINQKSEEFWDQVLADYAAAPSRRAFAAARGITDNAAMNLIAKAKRKP